MQTIIQVVCSKAGSLRDIIAGDNRLTNFGLEVVSERKSGRSPGWTKVRSKAQGVRGSINIQWNASTRILTCRIITRGKGKPNRAVGDFMDYLLAHHRSRTKVITVLPE